MTNKDPIDDLIRQTMEKLPTLTISEARAVEASLRSIWGGERVYIRKAPVAGKVQALAGCLAAGVPLREAIATVGASQRNGYRLLGRRWVDW